MLKAASAIREVVSMAILTELKDPRVRNVTVTFVEVAPDMRTAKVHVSIMGNETQQSLSLRGLQSSAGFLQQRLSKEIDTRYTPRLQFVLDKGVKHSIEVARMLRELLPGDKTETAPRHQELSFRATGSNVTLRQSVVVNGRFTPGTEAGRAGRARPAEAPSKIADLAARRVVPTTSNAFAGQYGAATNATSTIEGTVRIGTTNQQWFRAYRRAP